MKPSTTKPPRKTPPRRGATGKPKLKPSVGVSTRKVKTHVVADERRESHTTPKPTAKERKQEVIIFEDVDTKDLSPIQVRCRLFAQAYLSSFSCKTAAIKIGVPIASASVIGMRYFQHEYTQKLLRSWLLDAERDKELIRQTVLVQLLEEADRSARFQEMGSHRARIAALETVSKILGMQEKTVNLKTSNVGPPGVMLVPMPMSREQWEEEAKQRQAELKSSAKNPEQPDVL